MAQHETLKVNDFLHEYERLKDSLELPGGAAIARARQEAARRFERLGMPNTGMEDWRFTSIAPLLKQEFTHGEPGGAADTGGADLAMLTALSPVYLVFVDGYYQPGLSAPDGLPAGVRAGSLAASLEDLPPALEKHFNTHLRDESHPFPALNTALFRDGAFLHIPAGVVVETPIHLIFLSSGRADANVSHPRLLVAADQHSQATIIESYAGNDGDVYFTNAVAEFAIGDDAVVDHYRWQQESRDAFHFSTIDASLGRASSFSTQSFIFGGGLVRNDVGFTLNGQGCTGTMNGLYQISGRQLVDNHTRIDHAQPNCDTHELYKGIMDGHSRGVFNGRIMVRKIAQKTDAKQTNRSLLLSSDALISTNPQLEIFADDVKCTHGATIGQIDANQLYYLRSRGMPLEMARRVLVYAFANDVIERIKVETLRAELERRVLEGQAIPAPAPAEAVTGAA